MFDKHTKQLTKQHEGCNADMALRVATKQGPRDTRATNLRVVLQLLWHSDGLSRADISRASGLTRATVSDLVTELVDEGLIEQVGRGPSKVGKPATLLAVRRQSRTIVAVDLRPTFIRGSLIDLAGDFTNRMEMPVDGSDGQDLVAKVEEIVAALISAATSPILGIGIGTPGVVGPEGVVELADHLDWTEMALGPHLEELFGLPVKIENDANAAALAEFSYGAMTDSQETNSNLLVVRVARGIGGGIVLDGHPYYGEGSAAGEIGHIAVAETGPTCRVCGKEACLEGFVSLPAMKEALANGCSIEEVATNAGHWLGVALASAVSVLDVHNIVISGVPDDLNAVLCAATLERLKQRTLSSLGDAIELRPSTLGEDGILLGAMVSVLNDELGVA